MIAVILCKLQGINHKTVHDFAPDKNGCNFTRTLKWIRHSIHEKYTFHLPNMTYFLILHKEKNENSPTQRHNYTNTIRHSHIENSGMY